MPSFIIDLINNFGYLGLFLSMILEAVIIIIPSEAVLATGGILSYLKIFNFFYTFIIGLLGSVFCAIIIYFMGYYGGYNFIKKYGKYFFIDIKDIERSDSFLNKYGMISAMISRNIPILRTLISFPIGIKRLSFSKFVIFTTIGSIPWTFLFVYLGYSLGNSWIYINKYLEIFKIPIYIFIFIYLLKIFYKVLKKIRK